MMKPNDSGERMEAVASGIPEVALAKGVLVQARQDLRRFAGARDSVGREMYVDAYSWVTANDFTWPYSFQNVCKALRLSPESLRAELLPEFQGGWRARSRRMAEFMSSFRGSIANVFRSDRTNLSGRPSHRAVPAH